MKPQLKLTDGDRVVAARPERADGPGWRNEPLWVYVQRNGGKIREECLQPNEQTPSMRTLFATLSAAESEMIAAIERACRE